MLSFKSAVIVHLICVLQQYYQCWDLVSYLLLVHRKEELAISLSMTINYWGMGGENVGSHKNH